MSIGFCPIQGSKIISEEGNFYADLGNNGFLHKTVKHSENSVDPYIGACTNRVV